MSQQVKYSLLGISGSVFLLYFLGFLFPDFWWTTHFLSFLPSSYGVGILSISFALILFGVFGKGIRLPEIHMHHHFLFWMVGVFMGLVFYSFPIFYDQYGEAYLLQKHLSNLVNEIPEGTNDAFFTLSLAPWAGQKTILAIVTYIAYFGKLSYKQAFYALDVFCGVLFVVCSLYFIRSFFESKHWQIIAALLILTAPFLLNFYGHIEINAPVLLMSLLYGIALIQYLKTNQKKVLIFAIVLWVLHLKMHPLALMLFPGLALSYLMRNKEKNWLTPVFIGKIVLLPIFTIGAFCYFFVFEDHIDPRQMLDTAMQYDRLFLPLFSPEPPLDLYNMLSFNHIFDYLMELFLWSPLAVLILFVIVFGYRKQFDWKQANVLIIGLNAFLVAALFFVVNPLLSMQMDWDLLSLAAPTFILFVFVLIKEIEGEQIKEHLLPISIAMALLSLPIIPVHANKGMLSARLESTGIRIYKSYYEWGSRTILQSWRMMDDRKELTKRRRVVLNKLKPYSMPGIDYEYGRFYLDEAKYLLKELGNVETGLNYLDTAYYYYPHENRTNLYYVETHFQLKNFDQALDYSKRLIELQYPSLKEAIIITIQTALYANNATEAQKYCTLYIESWNDQGSINEIKAALDKGVPTDSLTVYFE